MRLIAHSASTSSGGLRCGGRRVAPRRERRHRGSLWVQCGVAILPSRTPSNSAAAVVVASNRSRLAMNYRRLGASGLKVSELSFGSWVTYGNQLGTDAARRVHGGRATTRASTSSTTPRSTRRASPRRSWARCCGRLGWRRSSYIVSTKFFWGLHDGPNEKNTLNRKYLTQAIDGSLARLGLDYVDLVFCHRADPDTPIEETVWAMHDMIAAGQGALLGHVGMERRRDHGGVADRRAAPPAQAGDGAAAVQPAPPRPRREGVRAALSTTSASARRSGARSRRAC